MELDRCQLHAENGHGDGGDDPAEVVRVGHDLGDVIFNLEQVECKSCDKGDQNGIEECLFEPHTALIARDQIRTERVHHHVGDDIEDDEHREDLRISAEYGDRERNAEEAVVGEDCAKAHHTARLFLTLEGGERLCDKEDVCGVGDADQCDNKDAEQKLPVHGKVVDRAGKDQKGHTHVHQHLGKRCRVLVPQHIALDKQISGHSQCRK